MTALTNN